MGKWRYTKGLHDLGNNTFAYLQPDGSWGWNNAGLIVDGDQSLLVDTLFDLTLTQEMLETMRAAAPAAKEFGTLVNTHANADHTYGNQLVGGAEIIASTAGAQEMNALPPEALAKIMRDAPRMGEMGAFLIEIFGVFDFEGIRLAPPTRTFDRELTLKVGDREVRLLEVGPAHTKGDVLVHVPADRTVFTGDILFTDAHPILWAGPVDNWINACERMLGWDIETVVPGHGPITDKYGIERMRDYFVFVRGEARKRYEAGMDAEEAANDIALDAFAGWSDAERIVVTIDTIYRGFRGEGGDPNVVGHFDKMARYRRTRAQAHAHAR